MANHFNLEINQAKRRHKKKLLMFSVMSVILAGSVLLTYLYKAAFRVTVVLKDFDSDTTLSLKSGSAINIGFSRIFLISDNASWEISALGYESEVLFLEKSSQVKIHNVLLDYSFNSVNISGTSIVRGAAWYLDDNLVSSSDILNTKLRPGTYKLKLMSKDYRDHESLIVIKPLQDFNQSLELKPKIISYSIATNPDGANVLVDGKSIGYSPLNGEFESSVVDIEVTLNGYNDVYERVDLSSSGQTLIRDYNLQSSLIPINVSYFPVGGTLYIDDFEKSATSEILINQVGLTQIQYSFPGYLDKTVKLKSGASNLELFLEPKYGRVSINASPTASVYIGNKYLGETPFSGEILAKKHKVKVLKDGYAPKEFDVDVAQGQEHTIDVSLETWSTYLLGKSSPEYVNSINVELKRFQGAAFTMGAPRSQRGQRANELLRRVGFNRAFYFSKYEITNGQYNLFTPTSGSPDDPIVGLSWNEAALYCNWLSKKEGLEPFYKARGNLIIGSIETSLGYRLPTEAEWEYVARVANKRETSVFVWGDEYEDTKFIGNLADSSAKGSVKNFLKSYSDTFKSISPIGSLKMEQSGVYDMSGNVSEWVHDFYSLELPDFDREYVNFLGSNNGSNHVIKGSNYLSYNWTELRASFRESANDGRGDVGFRIARYIN